jgi:hypothetical protein
LVRTISSLQSPGFGSPSKLAKVLFAFPESMLPECHELEENKTGKVFIARANRSREFEPVLVPNRGTFSSGPACTVGVASQGATNCGQRLPEAS